MTTALVRGQKVRVDQLTPATRLEVQVEVAGPVACDVSCFGLDQDGRLSDDAHFVFFNQLAAPGGGVTLTLGPSGGTFAVDLDAVLPTIARLVVAVTIDGTGTMGQVERCRATVSAAGAPVASYEASGSEYGAERALMLVELYRRDGWRLTVVGQGFDGGLDALLRHFGGEVAEDAAPPAAAPPVPPPATPPPPPAAAPPAPTLPPPPPAAPAPPKPNLTKLTLDKGQTVSLAKRQTVSLTKGGTSSLTKVRMGLGWDPAKAGANIDLDASCVVLGRDGRQVDLVWYRSLKGCKGAIRHQGDNLTGAGDGDDEVIGVDLGKLPAEVDALVFTVNSFSGQRFTDVARAFARLVDDRTGQELVRYDLTDAEPTSAVIMCVLFRTGDTWDLTAIGEFTEGRNAKVMVEPAQAVHRSLVR